MYREVIEHPWSLPPMIKPHLDLTSGRDRGRIYRIVPPEFRPTGHWSGAAGASRTQPPASLSDRKLPARPSQASTNELLELLDHPNGWHREMAARLLAESAEVSCVEPLRRRVREGQRPEGRFVRDVRAERARRALHCGSPIGARGSPPAGACHAVRLAESRAAAVPELRESVLQRHADDPALEVRFQIAFSLGPAAEHRMQSLLRLARCDVDQPYVLAAIQSSLAEQVTPLLIPLARDRGYLAQRGGRHFVRSLAEKWTAASSGRRRGGRGVDPGAEHIAAGDGCRDPDRALPRRRQRACSSPEKPTPFRLRCADYSSRLLRQRSTIKRTPRPGTEKWIDTLQLADLSRTRRGLCARLLEPAQPLPLQLAVLESLAVTPRTTSPPCC